MGQRGIPYELQQAKGENAKTPYTHTITNYVKIMELRQNYVKNIGITPKL